MFVEDNVGNNSSPGTGRANPLDLPNTDSISEQLELYRDRRYRIGQKYVDYDEIRSILKNIFNFDDFKSDDQELVTLKAINGESLFGVLATGSGKSMAFLLPAYLKRDTGVSLVISPLKALMDQFGGEHDQGYPWARAIHGDVLDRIDFWSSIRERRTHLVLCSPENLARPDFRDDFVRAVRESGRGISAVVLDEVHCIYEWGRDFRPEYWWLAHNLRDLDRVTRNVPAPRVLLTATANILAEREITRIVFGHDPKLLPSSNVIRGNSARPEIYLSIRQCKDFDEKIALLSRFLERQATRPLPNGTKRRVIVYNRSAVDRNDDDGQEHYMDDRWIPTNVLAVAIAERCRSENYSCNVDFFAAKGMRANEREDSIHRFESATARSGQVTVLVATSALGMGMDYPRIPGVVHFQPRDTLGEHWQQIGRAGREMDIKKGEWAESLGLFTKTDLKVATWSGSGQALDGIINSFSMPGLGIFFSWENPPGSPKIATVTKTGRQSKFSRFIDYLESELGVLDEGKTCYLFPSEWGKCTSHRIIFGALKGLVLSGMMGDLLKEKGYDTGHFKKYARYMYVASDSAPCEHITINKIDNRKDRSSTVHLRLGIWGEIGAIERDYSDNAPHRVRFNILRKEMDKSLVEDLMTSYRSLEDASKKEAENYATFLSATTNLERARIVQKYLMGDDRAVIDHIYINEASGDSIPDWL